MRQLKRKSLSATCHAAAFLLAVASGSGSLPTMNNWLIWALLSALFAALTGILAKVGVTDVNPNLATAIRTTVILVITWALALATSGKTDWSALTHRAWIFLATSGLMTGLSWLCYFRALKLGDVAKVAPVDKLSVALVIILAVIFLGEKVKTQEAIGAALIVLGVIVMVVKI
jgi:transporter family protein